MAGAEREVANSLFDRLLAAAQGFHAVLVAPEDVVDRHIHATALQVDAGEPFQVLEADQPFHRPPDPVVDPSRPGWEEHEDQVAQQVRLSEVDAGRVERLEDPVRVVSRPGRDIDNRQALDDHGRQQLKVKLFLVGTRKLDMAAEEAVCLADRILAARRGVSGDARGERRPVRLRREKPEARLRRLELIDQVQLVVALDCPRVRLRSRIADSGQDQHEGSQPLLPIHDQVRRDITCGGRNRRQHNAAEKMFRPRSSDAIRGLRVLLQDVPPQQPVIGDPPRVLALPQRHPELLLTLDELLQVRLAYLHLPSIGPPTSPVAAFHRPAHSQSPNTNCAGAASPPTPERLRAIGNSRSSRRRINTGAALSYTCVFGAGLGSCRRAARQGVTTAANSDGRSQRL